MNSSRKSTKPASGDAVYLLQDANYNVVATLSAGGAVPAGEPFEQYVYEPYGELVTVAVVNAGGPLNHVGHQGLFFDRLDDAIAPPLSAGAVGLYDNRNRSYSPELGRFLQRDPNATGAALVTALAMQGRSMALFASVFVPEGNYIDGMNLYGYVKASPVNTTDPLGLNADDWLDEFMAEYAVGILGVLGKLAEAKTGFLRGTVLSNMYAAAAFAWDGVVWDLGEQALFGLVTGGFGARACFTGDTLVLLANGLYKPIRDVNVGDAVHSMPESTEAGLVGIAANGNSENAERADWLRIDLRMQRSDYGTVNLSLLRPVAWATRAGMDVGSRVVVSVPEFGISGPADVLAIQQCSVPTPSVPSGKVVTAKVAYESAPILRLELEGFQHPLRATGNHPFYSLDRSAWIAVRDLRVGERLRTATGEAVVACVSAEDTLDAVFNIEVARTYSYFVGAAEAHVHNTCWKRFGVKSYRKLRTEIKDLGLRAHHLIEKRFAKVIGQNHNDMMSVALTPEKHQFFTNLWRQKIPYGSGRARATPEQVMEVAREIYAGYPEWRKALGL